MVIGAVVVGALVTVEVGQVVVAGGMFSGSFVFVAGLVTCVGLVAGDDQMLDVLGVFSEFGEFRPLGVLGEFREFRVLGVFGEFGLLALGPLAVRPPAVRLPAVGLGSRLDGARLGVAGGRRGALSRWIWVVHRAILTF